MIYADSSFEQYSKIQRLIARICGISVLCGGMSAELEYKEGSIVALEVAHTAAFTPQNPRTTVEESASIRFFRDCKFRQSRLALGENTRERDQRVMIAHVLNSREDKYRKDYVDHGEYR
jgi:hypothetical protein